VPPRITCGTGTLLWTIHFSPTDTQTVWLYEVYVDEAARLAHETAPGYAVGMQQTQARLAAPPAVVPLIPVGGKGLA
jgi:quinol monooxygenase YgiN